MKASRVGMAAALAMGVALMLPAAVRVRAAAPPPASASAHAPAGAPAAGSAPGTRSAYRLESVTLGIRHRVFQDFVDLQKVKLKQRFQVGDTRYSATVVEFVPDFSMGMKTGKVTSRSPEPNNPAFRIVVRMNGKVQDTTWALLNMPPHFAPRSMLAFKVARIDFVGRPPIVNSDTSSAAGRKGPVTPGSPGVGHGRMPPADSPRGADR